MGDLREHPDEPEPLEDSAQPQDNAEHEPEPLEDSTKPQGKAEPEGRMVFPPRRYTRGRRIRLIFVLPTLLVVGFCTPCTVGPMFIEVLQKSAGAYMLSVATMTFPLVFAVIGLVMIYNVHRHHRGATLDRRGVIFGSSPIGTATYVPWSKVRSFVITNEGIMLQLHGRLKSIHSRWLGPLVFCHGSRVNDVVMLLEEAGVARMEA